MRHRSYKIEHVPASLRPSLAAAMVRLADIRPGSVVLDPMCGAGTLLCEAVLFGRLLRRGNEEPLTVYGGDVDTSAVRAANVNLRQLGEFVVNPWDARDLPLEDESVDRILCNLPFGKQIGVAEEIGPLYDQAVPEFDRVLRRKGRAVLLTSNVPALKRAVRQVGWSQTRAVTVRVLGQKASILAWYKA
jgi:tRNA G10  N-methylase Trm11